MNLAPCPECARHVKVEEPSCPFCGATTEGLIAAEPRVVRDRTALLFGAAAVASALAVGACNNGSSGGSGTVVAPYGVPNPDSYDATPPPPPPLPTATARQGADTPSSDAGAKATRPTPTTSPTPVAVPAYGLPLPSSAAPPTKKP